MKYDALKLGGITQTFQVDTDDEGSYVEETQNVSPLVRELVFAYEAEMARASALAKELTDLRTRKWWDEVVYFTDRLTGNQVMVRTHYQLEMKGMRMEMSPEQFRMMR